MEIKSKFDALIKILDRIAITIILATIALSIVFVFGFAIYDHFKHKSDEITVKTSTLEKGGKGKKEDLTLKIGDVDRIISGNLYIARIEEKKDSYSVSYRAGDTILRNILLISDKGDKTHLLFDSYSNKIKTFHTLPEVDDAKAIVCSYVKNYNSDKDEDDEKISLMMLKPDGTQQTTLVDDVDRVLKVEIGKDNQIHAIYFKNGQLINATYSIENFKVINQPAVFDLAKSRLDLEHLN